MRIAFCDDDPGISSTLEAYLRVYFDEKGEPQPEYASYSSGEEFLEEHTMTDIAFLDVKMGGISGIELGRKLRETNPKLIIFMETSLPEYLDDAMRFHVFRYLSKPIDRKRLFRNMDDAIEQHRKNQRAHKRITLRTADCIYIVEASEILYIETMDHKTHVYTKNAEYSVRESLEYWITQLDPRMFFRTHRSFLVNMNYVTNIRINKVILCDGSYSVPLAGTRGKGFQEAYGKLLVNI
ncbi:MAG: LytTR family DNA-binding domain-containing protein [Clostridiales bacterium]|nr:LytTR family DNA-binding domain-containing protein [Clostridiales bacterium]